MGPFLQSQEEWPLRAGDTVSLPLTYPALASRPLPSAEHREGSHGLVVTQILSHRPLVAPQKVWVSRPLSRSWLGHPQARQDPSGKGGTWEERWPSPGLPLIHSRQGKHRGEPRRVRRRLG